MMLSNTLQQGNHHSSSLAKTRTHSCQKYLLYCCIESILGRASLCHLSQGTCAVPRGTHTSSFCDDTVKFRGGARSPWVLSTPVFIGDMTRRHFGGLYPRSKIARRSQGRYPAGVPIRGDSGPPIPPHFSDRRTLAVGTFFISWDRIRLETQDLAHL